MKALNIFEVFEKTSTRQIEPFHSQFLGEALRVSAKGDRTLFDAVWKRAAPKGWDIPHSPKIENEKGTDKDTNRGSRIDIVIRDEKRLRLLGIEVKTDRASAKKGQLEGYYDGLSEKYEKDEIAIAYLTPFNRGRAGDAADSLPTIKIFDEFKDKLKEKNRENVCHVSWLDIADIPWDGNELWRQHQDYVREEISNYEDIKSLLAVNQEFRRDFSSDAIENFWVALPLPNSDRKVDGSINIDLAELGNDALTLLVKALEILIEDDEKILIGANRKNGVSDALIGKFLQSKYGTAHHALFGLTRRYSHVFWQGETDYALRVPHKDRNGRSISLYRSRGERFLHIHNTRG